MRTVFLSVTVLVLLAGGCAERKESPEATPTAVETPKTIRTKTGIEMVLIPASEFTLGDDGGENDEQPAHRVRLAAYYIDVCEVTQASFQAILGRNPSKAKGPDRPVERVSWFTAVQYCNMRLDPRRPEALLRPEDAGLRFHGRRLPLANRSGVGVCLPRRDDHALVVRRRSRCVGQAWVVQGLCGKNNALREAETTQSVGVVRHARERGRMVQRLLRRSLRPEHNRKSSRPGNRLCTRAAWRQLDERR